MATVRDLSVDPVAKGLHVQLNKVRADLLKLKLGTVHHADTTATVVETAADDLPSLLVAVNEATTVFNAHCASACNATTGVGAHIVADATNAPVTTAAVVALSTSITRIRLLRDKMVLHIAQAGKHPTNDTVNTPASLSTDGGSLPEVCSACNLLTGTMNAHIRASFANEYVETIPA
jgi:hypothetical protein